MGDERLSGTAASQVKDNVLSLMGHCWVNHKFIKTYKETMVAN